MNTKSMAQNPFCTITQNTLKRKIYRDVLFSTSRCDIYLIILRLKIFLARSIECAPIPRKGCAASSKRANVSWKTIFNKAWTFNVEKFSANVWFRRVSVHLWLSKKIPISTVLACLGLSLTLYLANGLRYFNNFSLQCYLIYAAIFFENPLLLRLLSHAFFVKVAIVTIVLEEIFQCFCIGAERRWLAIWNVLFKCYLAFEK